METIEIIGYKRANLGKTDAARLRAENNVPCVLYGGEEQIHFYTPIILFRELVYTPKAYFVNVNVEGTVYKAILQDAQFHPVSETLLHADFLQLFDDRIVKMEVPVEFEGSAPGVQKGGKLIQKLRKVKVKGLPGNIPSSIKVNVDDLDLGKTVKIGAVEPDNFEIMNNPQVSIASVEIPRALRGKSEDEEGEEGEES